MNQPFSSTSPSNPPHGSQSDSNRNQSIAVALHACCALAQTTRDVRRPTPLVAIPNESPAPFMIARLRTGFTYAFNGARGSHEKDSNHSNGGADGR